MGENDFDGAFSKELDRLNKLLVKFMRDFAKDAPNMDNGSGTPFIYGLNMKIDRDGRPIMSNFNNIKQQDQTTLKLSEDAEALVDVLENSSTINVIAQISGVNKEKISVRILNNEVIIDASTQNKNYHKSINLPTTIDPESGKATYNNGVLELMFLKTNDNKQYAETSIMIQ